MDWLNELRKTLDEIRCDPTLSRNQWREAIDAKVKQLIEKYREEQSRKSSDE